MSKDNAKDVLYIPERPKVAYKSKEGLVVLKYEHLYTAKNPSWGSELRYLFIEHNLHAKVSAKALKTGVSGESLLQVSTSPKYLSWGKKLVLDTCTGEVISETYESDSEKKKRGRKVGKLREFDSVYLPIYREKKVSLLFITLTLASGSNNTISGLMKALKQRALRNDSKVLGYVWVSEVSLKYGTHWHYHLLVAIERLEVQRLPSWLKLEALWGKRTECKFVRRSGASIYLSKYLSKDSGSICDMRSYGASSKFEVPGSI